MENKTVCQICCEHFTTKLRHSITCDHCKNTVCLKCFKTFLLTDGSEQVCMCCNEGLSTEFIYLHTPKSFQKAFATKITNLEIIQEMALLKITQEKLNAQNRIKLLQSREKLFKTHLKRYSNDRTIKKLSDQTISEMDELKQFLEKSYNEHQQTSSSFICPLPGCNGVISKKACSTCENVICTKCHCVIEEENKDDHKCSEDILETIKLLKKDTKTCPSCFIPIHKIDGCDQMFCVNCKTAFSWRTRKIQTGVMHNPHYFEWLRQNKGVEIPRQIGDDPCNVKFEKALDDIFYNDNINVFDEMFKLSCRYDFLLIIESNFIPRVVREMEVLLPILRDSVHNIEKINNEKTTLRIDYIQKRDSKTNKKPKKPTLKDENDEKDEEKILKDSWFNKLRLIYKKREMKKDLIKLMEIFISGVKDAVILGNETKNFKQMLEIIISLFHYFRIQLKENETRHDLKNKTNLTIDRGIQCALVRW